MIISISNREVEKYLLDFSFSFFWDEPVRFFMFRNYGDSQGFQIVCFRRMNPERPIYTDTNIYVHYKRSWIGPDSNQMGRNWSEFGLVDISNLKSEVIQRIHTWWQEHLNRKSCFERLSISELSVQRVQIDWNFSLYFRIIKSYFSLQRDRWEGESKVWFQDPAIHKWNFSGFQFMSETPNR